MRSEEVVGGPSVLFFGTFDERLHPRTLVLREGLQHEGLAVTVINRPLGVSTANKVRIAATPVLAPLLVGLVLWRWCQLLWDSRRVRPDVVVVGYMGHLDIHLARVRFRHSTLVLDHLTGLAETLLDRDLGSGVKFKLLLAADKAAVRAADIVVVDTAEQAASLPCSPRRTVELPVGAPLVWHRAGQQRGAVTGALQVIFFGLFTPLQGTEVIANAIVLASDRCDAEFTLVGSGQDLPKAQSILNGYSNVAWRAWIEADELPQFVAQFDVCLGIFGSTAKALRVVPNKAYQGLAAGAVLITSDTEPQRRMANDVPTGRIHLVPPGDADALAAVIVKLCDELEEVRHKIVGSADQPVGPAEIGAVLAEAIT